MCLVDGCPFAFVNIFLPYCCWKAEPCSIFKFTRGLSHIASVLRDNYATVEIHPYFGCQRLACVQYLKRNVGSRKKQSVPKGDSLSHRARPTFHWAHNISFERLLRRLFMRGFGFRKVFIVTFCIKPHDQSANALIGYWRRANPEYGLNGLVQWPYQNIPPFASKTPGTRGIVVSVKVLFLRGV